jgi:hypothetical protein
MISGLNNIKLEKIRQILMIPVLLLIGFGGGMIIGSFIDLTDSSTGEIIVSATLLIIGLYVGMLLQIIIHEAGHLIFGLMSGYHFSSFRIGSFMLLKVDNTIKFKKLSIAGTGGQCLLIPPEMQNGKFPYILYNLGGSIINLISSAIFAGSAYLARGTVVLSEVLVIFSVIGFIFALINGLPMKLNNTNNDGYNTLSISRDSVSLRAFWIQLKVNELTASGVRLKDLPEEWFVLPNEEAMKNSMTSVISVLACSRLMDQMKFEDAKQHINKLLLMDSGIVGLHRGLLIADQIYCELVGENTQAVLDNLLDQKQKNFMKAMRRFPSILRTEYAYALIAEKDATKAAVIKKKFEKIALKYPYPSDITSERELLECAERKIVLV